MAILWKFIFVFIIVQCVENIRTAERLLDCQSQNGYYDRPLNICNISNLNWDIEDRVAHDNNQNYIQYIICTNCKFIHLPMNLFERFRELQNISLPDCQLETISMTAFSYAYKLVNINFSNNKIEKLDSFTFNLAPNLQTINLSNNLITSISENAFNYLKNLQTIDLSSNKIVSFNVDFTRLTSLQILRLQANQMQYFNANELPRSLSELLLNDNKITDFDFLPETLYFDSVFDISSNPIKSEKLLTIRSQILNVKDTNRSVCYIKRSVRVLDASYNQITSIIVENTENIVELNLSHNSLTNMGNLTTLAKLEKLDLSFNMIADIISSSFSNMTNLRVLNLQRSGLKSLQYGFLSFQDNLQFLDISYNKLGNIDFNVLSSLNKIQYLYIDGNDMSTIKEIDEFRKLFPKIDTIGITDNHFDCATLTEIIKSLNMNKITLFVREDRVMKNVGSVRGIACNQSDTSLLDPPMHFDHFASNISDTIQNNINHIINKIDSVNQTLIDKTQFNRNDYAMLKQEIWNLRNEFEMKLIDAKADIIISITSLLNSSGNASVHSIDLKMTFDQMNKINLERFELLSQRLMAEIKSNSQPSFEYQQSNETNQIGNDRSAADFGSMKILIIFIFVLMVVFVGLMLIVLKVIKTIVTSSKKKVAASRNTINTDADSNF